MRRSAAAVGFASALLMTGCAGNEYSLDDGVRDLQNDAGLTEVEAQCVVDGLRAEIGARELRGFGEATQRRRELLAGLLESCAGIS